MHNSYLKSKYIIVCCIMLLSYTTIIPWHFNMAHPVKVCASGGVDNFANNAQILSNGYSRCCVIYVKAEVRS